MRFKVLIFTLVLGLAGASAFSQSSSKDDTALKSLVKQMLDAQIAYDAKALDRIFTSDYIEISPVGEFDPRAKVLGFYTPEAKQAVGNVTVNVEVADQSIRVYDRFAIVIAQFNYNIVGAGNPIPPRSLRATIVCKRQKGDWKITSAQYTGIRSSQTKTAPTQ
jgi:uncharacterized protein (TIGR02246 family)